MIILLGFFPTLYPDEILYSVMARYKIRSGTVSSKATVGDLFGTKTHRAIIELPTNLASFLHQLPIGAEYVADEFISNHTLLPFYAPFLPEERVRLAIEAMLLNGGRGIYNIVGVTASSVKPFKFLRFCPNCFKADEDTFGEAYWHRIQQVPGVAVCPVHKVLLQDSIASIHDINPHHYQACTEAVCAIRPYAIRYSVRAMEELSNFSQDVDWLMHTRLASKGLIWYRERYLEALIQKGIATPNGRVFQRDLLLDFTQFYSKEYLHLMQSDVEFKDMSWLSIIVRNPRTASHPIRQLLMIRYLYGSAELFFTTLTAYQPFGHAPWICLNAGADHYLQPVVHKCKITYCSDTKKPVGTFSCDCGFVYSRRGPDISESDKYKIGRIKCFGRVWEGKLLELHSLGMSFRKIAQALNVDINTAIKYIKQLTANSFILQVTENIETDEKEDIESTHRTLWRQRQAEEPILTKTQLRKVLPKTYAWLYRHDREWLDENSPTLQQKRPDSKRVDWNFRDREVCKQIKSQVCKLLAISGKPERITINRIGKAAGVLALLQKNLDKMPMTEEYIRRVVESVQDFQIRRAKWTIRVLVKKNENLAKWKVLRLMGIRNNFSPLVEEFITDQLRKIECSK